MKHCITSKNPPNDSIAFDLFFGSPATHLWKAARLPPIFLGSYQLFLNASKLSGWTYVFSPIADQRAIADHAICIEAVRCNPRQLALVGDITLLLHWTKCFPVMRGSQLFGSIHRQKLLPADATAQVSVLLSDYAYLERKTAIKMCWS